MTDPINQAAPAEPVASSPAPATAPLAPAAPAGPNAMDTMVARYGMSTMIAAAGSLLIIAGDLLFSIFGSYGYSDVVWASAAVVLVTVTIGHLLPAVAANRNLVISLAALIAVLMSIREVVNDVAFLSTPGSTNVTWYLGAIAIYGGVALMAYGAWRLQAGER